MKIIKGDLWEEVGYKIIPTNMCVNQHGYASMGRGVAGQASEKFPSLKKEYAIFLRKHETRIQRFSLTNPLYIVEYANLIILPTKYHWRDKSDIALIKRGVQNLKLLSPEQFTKVSLPLIGCGLGELEENDVVPFLKQYLDDRFTLVLRDEDAARKYYSTPRSHVRVDKSTIYKKDEEWV